MIKLTLAARRGVTLVELMLVIAVLAFATGVVVMSAAPRSQTSTRLSARSALRRAAITSVRDTTVELFERGRRILITATSAGLLREDTIHLISTPPRSASAR